MINKFSILNGEKYFSSGVFKNYLELTHAKTYIRYFSVTMKSGIGLVQGNLMECQKKVLKI